MNDPNALAVPLQPADAPMVPLPCRVSSVSQELEDTFTLALEQPQGSAATFLPGQFNMLYRFGVGEAPVSISGDPNRPETLVHTIRAVGSVTAALCGLEPGHQVGVRGPFGTGWPVAEAEGCDVVLVAGGIGLAPLRPLIYELLQKRERYGCICLLYGGRSPDDILYRAELERWRGRFDLAVEVTVDRARPDWRGKVGVVTRLISGAEFDPSETRAFVCGPEIMMRYAAMALQDLGMADRHIYISMERNMKCAIGLCGHCQYGPTFVCRDGPVFRYDRLATWLGIREL
jgi:NAD(P)H-flavin reductase